MMKKTLLLVAIAMAACGMASASNLLITASGQFSTTDVADSPLVTPGGLFSLTVGINSNPTPVSGSVSSLSFDLPTYYVAYKLNGVAVSVSPTELTFYTAANGGLFAMDFGSSVTSPSFEFFGAQAFSGTTAAPLFSTGSYAVTNWIYSDGSNFDFQSPAAAVANVTAAPEPSTVFLIFGGMAALIGRKFRMG